MRPFRDDPDRDLTTQLKSYMPDFDTKSFNFKITVGQVLLFLLTLLLSGDPNNPSLCALLLLGAKVRSKKFTPLIVFDYQLYRLILPVMLHGSVMHLLVINIKGNSIFQLRFGFSAEKFYGTRRYIAIYLLSGIGGNVLSAYMMPNTVSIGASSSIFGLIALLGIYIGYNWHQLGPGRDCILMIYGFMVVYQFLESYFTPTIDLYGHLGGYIVGALVSVILLHREESSNRWNFIVAACFIGFCLYFAVLFFLLFGIDLNCSSDCHLCTGLKYNPKFG